MRKLTATLALAALVASTAEAAKTSEKEGRKFSRKYMKAAVREGDLPNFGGWNQRDCWRIGRDGVGYYRLFPRGVVCLFSSTRRFGPHDYCVVYGVAVKDGRKLFQAEGITHIQPYRGDPADCDPRAFMDWPNVFLPPVPIGDPL